MWNPQEQAARDAAIRNMFVRPATSTPTLPAPTAQVPTTPNRLGAGMPAQSVAPPTPAAAPQFEKPLSFKRWVLEESGLYKGNPYDIFSVPHAMRMYEMYLNSHMQMQGLQARYSPSAMSPLDMARTRHYDAMTATLNAELGTIGQPERIKPNTMINAANALRGYLENGITPPKDLLDLLGYEYEVDPASTEAGLGLSAMDDQQLRLLYSSLVSSVKYSQGGLPESSEVPAEAAAIKLLRRVQDEMMGRYGVQQPQVPTPGPDRIGSRILDLFGRPAAGPTPLSAPTTTAPTKVTIIGDDGQEYRVTPEQMKELDARGVPYTVR